MPMVERLAAGWPVAAVAAAAGVTTKTVRTWRDRFAAEGEPGLRDRSCRPHRSPARLGLGRLAALDPPRQVIRSQRERPGERIHLDTKELGRIDGIGHRITGDRTGQGRRHGAGWEVLHVAIDDASRLAYTALMPDEKKEGAVRFPNDALAWFKAHGLPVERIMTDHGAAFRSTLFAAAAQTHGLKHIRTRPYTPRTNGKAERLIQTSLREWAYASAFHNSAERARARPAWLCQYNSLSPRAALRGKPPISPLPGNNLLGNDC
jgi:transposase InsO family protein